MPRSNVLESIPSRPGARRSTHQPVPPVRKGRKPPPEGETPRGRFLRIGQPRVVSAVKALRLLANLARGDYDWHVSDVQRMRLTLQTELDKVLNEFEQSDTMSKKHVDFHFDTTELEDVLSSH